MRAASAPASRRLVKPHVRLLAPLEAASAADKLSRFTPTELNMNIAVHLTEEEARRLAEIADRLNIPQESLAQAAVRELVDAHDADFDGIMARLVTKNRELYERLR